MCDTDFFETGEKRTNLEPTATDLAIKIQNGTNVADDKNELALLLLPFILRNANYYLSSLFDPKDVYDVIQQFIYQHILNDDDKYKEKMYLYKYDRAKSNLSTYLIGKIKSYCKNWKRDFCDANHRDLLKNDDSNLNGNAVGLHIDAISSINKYHLDEEQKAAKELLRLLAPKFLDFFNAVNILDKDKTCQRPFQDGERVVNEQKLLAYHIRFINSEFDPPKVESNTPDIRKLRAFTFLQVNQYNNTYLIRRIFMVNLNYMKLLEERIISRNLTDTVFLPPEKDIHDTVDEWLRSPRMNDRIELERSKLQNEIERLREEYHYEVK